MSIKNKIIRNTSIISSSGILLGILNFIVVSILVSHLGFEKYGVFVFILYFSVNNGFMSLFDFGIKSITTKYISQHLALNEYSKINEFINFSFFLSILIGVVISLFTLLFFHNIESYFVDINTYSGFFDTFKWFVLSYVLQFVNYTFIGIYEGFQRYDISKIMEVFFYVLQSILIITIVLLNLQINYFIYVFIFIFTINFVINIIVFKRLFEFRLCFNNMRISAVKFYDIAKHMFPTQLSSMVYNQYPKFFILSFLNTTSLGIYDVIVKIPRFLKTIAGFINSALMPAVSELTALGKNESVNNIYELGFRLNLFILVPILTAVIYFAQPIMHIWINDTMHYQYMQVFVIWNLLVPYVTFGGPLLVGMNKELKFMKNVSWSITIISIVVSLILIRDLELWGIVFGQLSGLILLPIIFSKYMEIFAVNKFAFIKSNILIYLIAIIPIVFFEYFANVSSMITLIISGFVWCSIYWLLIYFVILNQKEKIILREVSYNLIKRFRK